jgi:hypothetical protein
MNVIRRFGGSLAPLFEVRARRAESFQKERDRRPETWHIEWQGVHKPAVRQALGLLIGEPTRHAGFSPAPEPSPVPS